MPLQLPTDTRYTRLATRQFELLNRRLGQGIERPKIWVALAAAGVWFPVLALVGISPLVRFGPMLYLGPVTVFVVLGTRTGEDGRMQLMAWYDALLARLPRHRRPITNPLLDLPDGHDAPLILRVTTRVVTTPTPLTPTPHRNRGAR